MFQVRIHGRGGQGVVTAAEMLSIAAFDEGKHAQAIPSFGSERMGAPVVAYVRIDDDPIELTEPVLRPDLLIVQDPTLFHAVDVFSGLADDVPPKNDCSPEPPVPVVVTPSPGLATSGFSWPSSGFHHELEAVMTSSPQARLSASL